MRAKELKKRFHNEWKTIEEAIWIDAKDQAKRLKLTKLLHPDFNKLLSIVSYNAAFVACSIFNDREQSR